MLGYDGVGGGGHWSGGLGGARSSRPASESHWGQENGTAEETGTRLGMVDDRVQRRFLLLFTSILIPGEGGLGQSHSPDPRVTCPADEL